MIKNRLASALLQSIIDQGLRVFGVEEVKNISDPIGIRPEYLSRVLAALVKDGWLKKLKKGCYIIGPSISFSPIHEFEIAMHVVTPSIISHYSAFSFHGLTEQIPKDVFVTTLPTTGTGGLIAGSKHKTAFKFENILYKIIKVKKEHFFGQMKASLGESCFLITDLERTILDGFTMPKHCGGIREVLYGLGEKIDHIELNKIINYAQRLDISVARRLGWALEQCGIENENTLALIQEESPGYRILDPTNPEKGKYSKKWRLRLNY